MNLEGWYCDTKSADKNGWKQNKNDFLFFGRKSNEIIPPSFKLTILSSLIFDWQFKIFCTKCLEIISFVHQNLLIVLKKSVLCYSFNSDNLIDDGSPATLFLRKTSVDDFRFHLFLSFRGVMTRKNENIYFLVQRRFIPSRCFSLRAFLWQLKWKAARIQQKIDKTHIIELKRNFREKMFCKITAVVLCFW